MDVPQNDLDRLVFFEHARKTAESAYAKNPLDADAEASREVRRRALDDMVWESVQLLCTLEAWRAAVLWTLSLLYSHLYLLLTALFPALVKPPPSFPRRRCAPDPDSMIKHPVCIVTGATSGLGAAAARALAREGYHVVLEFPLFPLHAPLPVGRNLQLLEKTLQEIKQQERDACLHAFQVDMSSIQSIMKFKKSMDQWIEACNLHPSIQLLMNNAGILAKSSRVTADGLDQMMETNYFGAFFLTNLLLPLLKNSPIPSRIVNVASFTHRCARAKLALEKIYCSSTSENYPFAQKYEVSKLCLLLFSYALHQRIYVMDPASAVSITSADPGFVKTNIMHEFPPLLCSLAFNVLGFLGLLKPPEDGVDSIIDAALAPHEASGKYFFGGKGRTLKSSSISYDAKLAEELWSTSSMLFQELQRKSEE